MYLLISINLKDNFMKKETKAQKKMAKVMREYKAGKLKGGINPKGPKKAPIVKSRKQAVAIGLAISGMGRKMMKKKRGMK